MITHLGKSVSEINAKQAAHENRILVCLQKRGPMRESDVKLYTGAICRVGHEIHDKAVSSLVAQGLIRKLTTTRANSFILELTGAEAGIVQSSSFAAALAKIREHKFATAASRTSLEFVPDDKLARRRGR